MHVTLLSKEKYHSAHDGILFAGTRALIAISPLGKLSGGRINPAVSDGYWM